jgi:hypothetical protein
MCRTKVRTVSDAFAMSKLTTTNHYEARVLVARLGSEGILAETREAGVAQYPGGPVQVWVLTNHLADAEELLIVEVEGDVDRTHHRKVTKRFAAVLAFGLLLMIAWPVARIMLNF